MTTSPFTVALIKSPSVGRQHALQILSRIAQGGMVVHALEYKTLCRTTIASFYHQHAGKSHYPNLSASVGREIVAMVLSDRLGGDAVLKWRALMGATDARTAQPGTIRHSFGGFNWRGDSAPIADNAVHGSDSAKAALYEYSLLFNAPNWPRDPNELLRA